MSRSMILPVLIAVSVSAVCNPAGAEPSESQEREIYNAGGVGFEMSWRVPQEKLDASQWNTKSEPPLSAAQAVTKARSYLASHGQPSQLPIAWLQLLHVNDAPPTCFVYVLQFADLASNPANGNLIVMLLDGSVVVPVTTRSDAKNSHAANTAEAQAINNSPDVLRLIRNAETVYVFPVTSPLKPQRDDGHMRLLGPEARKDIVQLLGNDGSWWHGLSAIGIPENQPTNIGLLFRSGKDELVLFFNSETVEGKLHEIELGGLLEKKPKEEFEAWKRRYAQAELAFK